MPRKKTSKKPTKGPSKRERPKRCECDWIGGDVPTVHTCPGCKRDVRLYRDDVVHGKGAHWHRTCWLGDRIKALETVEDGLRDAICFQCQMLSTRKKFDYSCDNCMNGPRPHNPLSKALGRIAELEKQLEDEVERHHKTSHAHGLLNTQGLEQWDELQKVKAELKKKNEIIRSAGWCPKHGQPYNQHHSPTEDWCPECAKDAPRKPVDIKLCPENGYDNYLCKSCPNIDRCPKPPPQERPDAVKSVNGRKDDKMCDMNCEKVHKVGTCKHQYDYKAYEVWKGLKALQVMNDALDAELKKKDDAIRWFCEQIDACPCMETDDKHPCPADAPRRASRTFRAKEKKMRGAVILPEAETPRTRDSRRKT